MKGVHGLLREILSLLVTIQHDTDMLGWGGRWHLAQPGGHQGSLLGGGSSAGAKYRKTRRSWS